MFTKTALTAALILGTASVALASEADPSLLYRNQAQAQTAPSFQTRNVALPSGGQSSIRSEQSWFDRASQGTGGGY